MRAASRHLRRVLAGTNLHPGPPPPAGEGEGPRRVRRAMGLCAAVAAALFALAAPAPSRAEDRAALMERHRGGTLRLLSRASAGTIDPQRNYTAQYWQVFAAVYDGLVAFRKAPGRAGGEIVPDLADAVPTAEDDGLTYRFRLRPGVRFSDGGPVRPSDAAASFRRIFRVLSPTAEGFYGAIAGADACLRAPETCALEGVQADDAAGTVVIHLTRPDPEFLLKLALPHASVLPEHAPPRDAGTTPLPGTGPYAIASYDPGARMRLVRNPHFREWSADAQPDGFPDEVHYDFGFEDVAEVTMVQRGQADWMFDTPPADRLGELGARHAGQVHLNPANAIWYVPMNVNLPPFDDVRVRRAVNLAIDRRAAVKLFGGGALAAPLCQVLPPGLPGHEPHCPYERDLERARALVADAGATGRSVTLITDDSAVQRALGTLLQDALRDIGLDARTRALSASVQFTYIQNSANRVGISLTSWYADYPSPNVLLGLLFGCATFRPESDSSPNISGFCDPALDARMRAALHAPDPAEAARLWAAVDRAVTDAAPAAVLFTPRYIDFVSARVGRFLYHDQFHWLFTHSWVR